jgi:hypothetical protein
MDTWLIVVIVVVVIAIAWYIWQQNTRSAERKRAADARWQQTPDEPERTAASHSAREGGLLQAAADTASGKEYEAATEQLNEMTDRLAAAREQADREAARLAGRADLALASVQAAASAHGGAVPGDGTHDCPPDYPIKGNMPSQLYHLPGQPSYSRTIPEVCFQSVAAAEAAGFTESGDEAGMRARAAAARESAALEQRDIAAVANEAGSVDTAEGEAADIVAAAIAAADAGSVPPGAIRGDGGRDCPPSYPIKGNETTRRFHAPGMAAYDTMVPQLCFSSVESAVAAGYALAQQ